MNSLGRIAAIVRTDFLLRFRRVSTVVVFLLLSAFAYLWVPAPSTGRTLIQINGQRAIYNSGALGLATASLGMIFVGLFGYYVISNAIRRDITSRCGFVIAATPMRSIEYLLGKFCGNLAFLVTFLGGFMLSSMAMLLVRGEARLEPLVFVRQYFLLASPAIVLVSATAVFFESVRFLSGKFGDVVYFFLFMTFIGLVAGNEASGGRIPWARCFDFSGFGFLISEMQHTLHTESVSIGSSPFDPAKPTIVFPGLTMTRDWLIPRIVSLILPLTLLPAAALVFHRFDPVRIGRTTGTSHRKWLSKLQSLLKPFSRRVVALLMIPVRSNSFAAAVWQDAVLTFTLSPIALIALVVMSFVGLRSGNLSIVFAVLAIVICDVATRDVRAGTVVSLYAAPRLRERFALWKFGSTCLTSLLFCLAPLVAAMATGSPRFLALIVALVFISALATLLGVVTQNAKTFIVVFLSFWYLVVNDKGATPMLDFAGFNHVATPRTIATYAIVGIAAILLAQITHRMRLARI
jgi:hypothetical protein